MHVYCTCDLCMIYIYVKYVYVCTYFYILYSYPKHLHGQTTHHSLTICLQLLLSSRLFYPGQDFPLALLPLHWKTGSSNLPSELVSEFSVHHLWLSRQDLTIHCEWLKTCLPLMVFTFSNAKTMQIILIHGVFSYKSRPKGGLAYMNSLWWRKWQALFVQNKC